jgi:hypothetical protein
MISAFSRFSAFLGSPTRVFANMANTARIITTPMNRMLVVNVTFLACAIKQCFKTEIVRSLAPREVGYQGCCPEPAFAMSWCRDWLADSGHDGGQLPGRFSSGALVRKTLGGQECLGGEIA